MAVVTEMIREVKSLGMETCVTLGMLQDGQAEQLRAAGLDYYNHNLDTSPEFYGHIITTRQYQDRLDTLERVRQAGINPTFGYQIFVGQRNPSRHKLLQLAFAMKLSLRETNRLLQAGGCNELYCKNRRDAIIIFCINHGETLQTADEQLYAFHEDTITE